MKIKLKIEQLAFFEDISHMEFSVMICKSLARGSARKEGFAHRIAPGSTVTSAAAIVLEILKVEESTTFTPPPERFVDLTLEKAKEKGLSTCPCGLFTAVFSSGRSISGKTRLCNRRQSTHWQGKYRALLQERFGRQKYLYWGLRIGALNLWITTHTWKFFASTV